MISKKPVSEVQKQSLPEELEISFSFQNILNKLPHGVIVVDPRKTVRFMNPAAERLLSQSAEKLVSERFTYPLEVGEATEIDVRLPNGQILVTEMRVTEVEWENRPAFLVSLTDITDRKQAVEALRESEMYFRTILENAAIGIGIDDLDGRTIKCNPALERILGYSEQELQNMVYTEFSYPEELETERKLYQELLAGKRDAFHYEKRYIRKGGEVIWGNLTISLLHEPGREPQYYIALLEDITDRKRAIEAVRQSEERWRSLAENNPNLVLTTDIHGNVVYTNRPIGSITVEQIVGSKVYEWVLPEHQEQLNDVFETAIASGEHSRYEFSGIGTHGSTSWFIANVIPLTHNGEIVGSTVVINDITDRKRMEDELLDYAHRLEALRKLDQAILAAQSPQSIAEAALEHIQELVPYFRASVSIFSARADEDNLLIVREDGQTRFDINTPILIEDTVLRRLRLGKRHLVTDIDTQTRESALDKLLRDANIRTYAILPLISSDELVGILNLTSKVPGSFTSEHLEIASEVADLLAVAIQQARLLGQVQRRAVELETLLQISSALRGVDAYAKLISIIIEQSIATLQAERGALLLLEERALVFAACHGLSEAYLGQRIPEDIGPWWQVVHTDKPLFITNPEKQAPSGFAERSLTHDLALLVLIPLKGSEGPIGVLNLGFEHRSEFSAYEKRLFTAIADIASNALQRVKLFQTLELQIAERTRELTLLYEVTAATSELSDLRTMLDNSLAKILATLFTDTGTIHFLDEKHETLNLFVQRGLSPEIASHIESLALRGNLWAWVLNHKAPLIVADLTSDARVPQIMKSPRSNGQKFHAYVGVPIQSGLKTVGVLSIFEKSAKKIIKDKVELLVTIADQIGAAVERGQLRQQAEKALIIEERQRLARDLHDSVTQLLYSQALLGEASRKFVIQGESNKALHYLNELVETAQQALKEMRLMIFELRPTVLEKEGLVGALKYRLETVEQRAGISACLVGEEISGLTGEEEEALYRITQEALNNALQHAQASDVTVALQAINGYFELEVIDNGKGFNLENVSEGIGLKNIRERVERLKGSLTITSNPGIGTSIKVSFLPELEKTLWPKPSKF